MSHAWLLHREAWTDVRVDACMAVYSALVEVYTRRVELVCEDAFAS